MAKNRNNYPRRQQSWPSQTPAVPRPNNCHLWHWGDEGEGTLHTTPINEKEQQQTLAGASYNQSMRCFTGCKLVSKLPVSIFAFTSTFSNTALFYLNYSFSSRAFLVYGGTLSGRIFSRFKHFREDIVPSARI